VKWDGILVNGTILVRKNPVHIFGKKGRFEVDIDNNDQSGCTQPYQPSINYQSYAESCFPYWVYALWMPLKSTFARKFKGISKLDLMIFNSWRPWSSAWWANYWQAGMVLRWKGLWGGLFFFFFDKKKKNFSPFPKGFFFFFFFLLFIYTEWP